MYQKIYVTFICTDVYFYFSVFTFCLRKKEETDSSEPEFSFFSYITGELFTFSKPQLVTGKPKRVTVFFGHFLLYCLMRNIYWIFSDSLMNLQNIITKVIHVQREIFKLYRSVEWKILPSSPFKDKEDQQFPMYCSKNFVSKQ